MIFEKNSKHTHAIRHRRVRKVVSGTTEKPRLLVFRSLKHIHSQLIDDSKGHTLAAASSLDTEIKDKKNGTPKTAISRLVGSLIAKRAIEAGISQVVFDRGGYKYHGRVKALADGAREGGLIF
ncbi:MAG: 50S ribosomal protein L18 [Chloroflexi bacterium]|nr:50S ribosomal protein L18 [Chloroflexota bacterium]